MTTSVLPRCINTFAKTLLFTIILLTGFEAFAKSYDVGREDFPGSTYVGKYRLRDGAMGFLNRFGENWRKHLFTVTLDFPSQEENGSRTKYHVPDLIYPILDDERGGIASRNSLGLRLIPVGNHDESTFEYRRHPFLNFIIGNLGEWIPDVAYWDFTDQALNRMTQNGAEYYQSREGWQEEWEHFWLRNEDGTWETHEREGEISFQVDIDRYYDSVDNWVDIPENVRTPEGESPNTRLIDALIKDISYGAENKDEDLPIYAIVGHTGGYDTYYDNLQSLASAKIETSINHVSTHYGANEFSRRGFLYGGHPNNVFTISMKNADPAALNLNSKIWAKMYYQNPEDYQFADDYSFDYFVNSNLEEVLAFTTGWLDHQWVRKDLNRKIATIFSDRKNEADALSRPYYEMLQEEEVFGLYCFEGVTNALNIAVNVPLTREYFQRIWGGQQGIKLFEAANKLWIQVQFNEIRRKYDLTAAQQRDVLQELNSTGQVSHEALTEEERDQISSHVQSLNELEPILRNMQALWDLKGMLPDAEVITAHSPLFPNRDYDASIIPYSEDEEDIASARAWTEGEGAELRTELDAAYKKIGNSLAWRPQTTAEIIKDLIVFYVPFHKATAARSTAVILNFKEKHNRRTGMSTETYFQYALPLIHKMFYWEASLLKTKNAQLIQNGEMSPEAAQQDFSDYLTKVQAFFNGLELGHLYHNPEGTGGDVEASIAESEVMSLNAHEEFKMNLGYSLPTIAWNRFDKESKEIIAEANKEPVSEPDILMQIANDEKYVKYYSRPGLLASMSLGLHPTNPHFKLSPIATVISVGMVEEQEDAPLAEDPQRQQYYSKNQDFINSTVSNRALRAFKKSLLDPQQNL